MKHRSGVCVLLCLLAPALVAQEASPGGVNELLLMPRSSFVAEGQQTGAISGFGAAFGYNRWLGPTFALGIRGGLSALQSGGSTAITDAEVLGVLTIATSGSLDWLRLTLQGGRTILGTVSPVAGFSVGAALAVSPVLSLQFELGFRSVPSRDPAVEQVGAVGIGLRFGAPVPVPALQPAEDPEASDPGGETGSDPDTSE